MVHNMSNKLKIHTKYYIQRIHTEYYTQISSIYKLGKWFVKIQKENYRNKRTTNFYK